MWMLLTAVIFQLETTTMSEESEPFQKVFYSPNDLKSWIIGSFEKLQKAAPGEKDMVLDIISTLSDEELGVLLDNLNKSSAKERLRILKQLVAQILLKSQVSFQSIVKAPVDRQTNLSLTNVSSVDDTAGQTVALDKKMLLILAKKIFPGFLLNDATLQEEALSVLGELYIQFGEKRVERAASMLSSDKEFLQGNIMTQIDLLREKVEILK